MEVAGDWGTGGSATCTTDAAGTCWVSVSLNSKKVDSTTFTVVRLSRDGYTYPGVNSDVEGDSNGTSILVRL